MNTWSEPRCFGDVWADAVARQPDAPFLIFEGPSGAVRHWTYGEFDSLVARMATELASQWCAEQLTTAERPRDIMFVEELPRTSVGMIRKFLLKDPTAEQGASR